MKHLLFSESDGPFPVSIIIKPSNLKRADILTYYIKPCEDTGLSKKDFIAWDLKYNEKGNAPKKLVLEYLEKSLLPAISNVGSKYIIAADGDYFKALTGATKTAPHYGYVKDCKIKGYEDLKIVLVPNYAGTFYNPAMQQNIDLGLTAFRNHVKGLSSTFEKSVLENVEYISDPTAPDYLARVEQALLDLKSIPELAIDIEAFSLNFWEAGIGTISFSINKHSAVVINIDCQALEDGVEYPENIHFTQSDNQPAKKLLRKFFDTYNGKTVWHNANYDVKVLVFELYMKKDFFNYTGMHYGIETLLHNIDDTKLITYLATNNCGGNVLGLKQNTHEFTGNYAMDDDDIKDIRRIPLDKLMEYNGIDTCATMYLKEKYYQTMVDDEQLPVYETIFKPSMKVIMQMELTGVPINYEKAKEVDAQLRKIRDDFHDELMQIPTIKSFWFELRQKESDAAHAKWKKKTAPIEDFNYVMFNPNSSTQLQHLMYDFMGYEVMDTTKSGQPATDKDALKSLTNRAKNDEHRRIFECISGISEVANLISTFMNAFLTKSIKKSDGWYWLHGNFNLGGTLSGRLSSSGPNLQNMPNTGTRFGSLIKSCIQAPPGKILAGADYSSLEDRISALTTKDPNKLKVYLDGFDGHCLRAYYYFTDDMPDIVETVDSINSIADKYSQLRQDSKAPTFALTYQGTAYTLQKNLGWSKEKAESVEKAYHDMYQVSDEWVQNHIKNACDTGYVTVAFGLRVRTPVLSKSIYDRDKMIYAAQAESRSAGNALGQSYGMLNNRAAIEFRERTLRSEYINSILPIMHIHDAQYFIVDNTVECVKWLNDNLIPCMEWQELPEIQHDEVKLGGELDLFYPDWSNGITIPNGASENKIITICEEYNDSKN